MALTVTASLATAPGLAAQKRQVPAKKPTAKPPAAKTAAAKTTSPEIKCPSLIGMGVKTIRSFCDVPAGTGVGLSSALTVHAADVFRESASAAAVERASTKRSIGVFIL